ncbi:MAG: hypothetical protein JXB50_16125 [Spirochaetes bacterium]|nr:hypothetical protein [Spirochaetota bacterium]
MKIKIYSLFIILLFYTGFSCLKYEKKVNLKNIFKFNIGYDEDEIGILSQNEAVDFESINIFYINGFYLISDLKNRKIIKATENGLINLVIFNQEYNPKLISTKNLNDLTADKDETVFLKLYIDFAELYPNLIAADIDRNIYVENINPMYKKYNDDGTVFDALIIKFDRKGNFLLKIGRDGINTLPFSKIMNMVTDNNGNLIILEKLTNNYNFYKFNSDGQLIYKNSFTRDNIPLTDKENDMLVDIVNIVPGYKNDEIFILCQYITENEKLKIKTYSTAYEKVLKYSLKLNKITKMALKLTPEYLDLTKIKQTEMIRILYGQNKKVLKPLKNFIGVDGFNNLYFIQRELPLNSIYDNKNQLIVYDQEGNLKENLFFDIPDNINFISKFYISHEGKIYFFYIKQGEIQFVTI